MLALHVEGVSFGSLQIGPHTVFAFSCQGTMEKEASSCLSARGRMWLLLVVGIAVTAAVVVTLVVTLQASAGGGASEELRGSEDLMRPTAYGTCAAPFPAALRWGADVGTGRQICCYNRHWAEEWGYWETTPFADQAKAGTVFYDPVTGLKLFVAPGPSRSWADFLAESQAHGWPSFRDDEVVAENVRVLPDGEVVSVNGTHLGHNLPDAAGNRYCINLVCVAGQPRSDQD